MSPTVPSLRAEDLAFRDEVERCAFPGSAFRHREHVRLAWIYLREDHATAAARMCATIRAFAAHHHDARKYHETMTLAWLQLIGAAATATPDIDQFEQFAARHPHLFEKTVLDSYYSPARLGSAEARVGWLPPDRSPFPEIR